MRLIDQNDKQLGIVSISEALVIAKKAGLDLVEIAAKASPPVCKILDFGQYHYHKERKFRESRKKQHVVQIKEIKFGPNTDDHDFNFKKTNAIKFLKQHNKVKFTVRFKGRQLAHKDLGFKLLEKLSIELKDIINIDSHAKSEGRTISMIVSPKNNIDKYFEEKDKENIEQT